MKFFAVTNETPSVHSTKRPGSSGNRPVYSADIKAKMAVDAIKLGVTETGRRWAEHLGRTVPVSTIRRWRDTYLKQMTNWIQGEIDECRQILPKDALITLELNSTSLESKVSALESKLASLESQASKLPTPFTVGNVNTLDSPLLPTLSDLQLPGRMKEISVNNPVAVTKGTKPKRNANRYPDEVKAEITADAIKLGPTEASRRWSDRLGYRVPVSTIRGWKKKNMNNYSDSPVEGRLHTVEPVRTYDLLSLPKQSPLYVEDSTDPIATEPVYTDAIKMEPADMDVSKIEFVDIYNIKMEPFDIDAIKIEPVDTYFINGEPLYNDHTETDVSNIQDTDIHQWLQQELLRLAPAVV